jgi:YD repeat-containing protein
MLSALYGDGATQTRSYDLSYRLTGIVDAKAALSLRNVSYGYEGRDNLSTVTDALVPANSETFSYTPLESLSGATGPYGALVYSYSGVGNRLTAKLGAATDAYSYPATSNRLSGITLAAGGARAFTYDLAGNVVSETRTGGAYAYVYTVAGGLRAIEALKVDHAVTVGGTTVK